MLCTNDKRKKNPNMTYSEKLLLLELVEKHYKVIANKKIDGASMLAKNAEWQKIAEQFNASGLGSIRASANLRCTWENFKKKARRAVAEAKLQRVLAGGEARTRIRAGPILRRVLALLQTPAEGLANSHDGDIHSTNAGQEVYVLASGSVDGAPVELSFDEPDWREYSILRNPTHSTTSPSGTNQGADNIIGTPDATTSDELASPSGEQVAMGSWARSRSALQESMENLHALKAVAAARAVEQKSEELQWKEELHKAQLEQEKIKVEILKEQLKQEKLKTEKLLLDLGK